MRIITSNNCLSAGDALRDIDQRGVVRSDPFVLVSGDVVSNIDLKSVIKQVRSSGLLVLAVFGPPPSFPLSRTSNAAVTGTEMHVFDVLVSTAFFRCCSSLTTPPNTFLSIYCILYTTRKFIYATSAN